MLHIFKYLSSTDIAEYCVKIGHIFNSLEMAIVIAHSEKTMEEKHIAWRALISGYPDMPIHESLNFEAKDSLHDYLNELIDYEEKVTRDFYNKDTFYLVPENESLYQLRYSENDNCYVIGFYSSVDNALSAWREYSTKNELEKEDNVSGITIEKHFINVGAETDEFANSSAFFDLNGNLLSISFNNNNFDDLRDIFFHLPVPFKKGDLVVNNEGRPSVLTYMPHWGEKYEDYLSGKRGDGSDMIWHGIFNIDWGYLVEDCDPWSLLSLQYYREELKGSERFLKYLSKYIKEDDDGIAWLLNVYQKFQTEAISEEARSLFGGWYLPLEE